MKLPPDYAWLSTLSPLPRMVAEGLALYGTTEVVGTGNNPEILAWAREADLAKVYTADAIAWCGLFAAITAKRAGKIAPDKPLWALNWANFGRPLRAGEEPSLGDVLTFKRDGGGHVGIYVGEDATAFHVLGGNQGDKVGFARIAKRRLNSVRRPIYQVQPATVRPFYLSATGALSTNEA